MFQIDLKSRKAIYEQIVDNFKRLITTGVLKENDKAPSIRDMSKFLTVNPNTIQKAYRELENQGYFYTVLGQGSFISSSPQEVSRQDITAVYERLREVAHELMYFGETTESIIDFIKKESEQVYDKGRKSDKDV